MAAITVNAWIGSNPIYNFIHVEVVYYRHPGDVKITSDETGRNTIKYHVKPKERKLK